ncbi:MULTISPECIES: cobalt-precorrin-6A reductase [Cetobacterium]|jgi:precorrin-6A/cobalt-precorrin-6A reductase|uniref:Cobalt-precorrin-6A reductase n=1 Tax=Candidatus Cetobacterium colombiensis TaxID=3073100 RepID=A0ABU4W6H6_9FUSO|nr:cobalt-precorrin-6A reductase [Candidatus Cetobacterium colombiensis]MDX8335133.1 cobalt-precorrin-6A reductase [Candidatus Cetobacterium colombiensis]
MIWIIGGTKDSRDFIESFPFKEKLIITTATEYGGKLLESVKDIRVLCKRLDTEAMNEFVERNSIEIILDLSHPYAEEVSKNAIKCSKEKNIKYVRFERENLISEEEVIEFSHIENLVEYLEKLNENILVTLGSNNLDKFKNLKNKSNIYFRILPKWEMIKKAEDFGILPKNIIAMQGPFSKELNTAMMKQYNIKYMVSKKGGDTGGEKEKIASAKEMGITLIMLSRPKIDYPVVFSNLREVLEYII